MVDDAYAEYVTKKDYKSGLEIFNDSLNTVVCRTFSKIYGLANLRIGWGFGSRDIIHLQIYFVHPSIYQGC